MTATRPNRILIVRLAALGDVVMASAVLQRIRAEQPGAHVTWLTGRSAAPIVKLYDGVDEVLALDEQQLLRGGTVERLRVIAQTWTWLARRNFDVVLLGHPDPRYRILVAPLRRATLHAFTRHHHGRMIPIHGRYTGDEYARLLDGAESHRGPVPGRWPISDVRARLPAARVLPDPPEPLRWVTLVPGGARNVLRENALRRWPVERYAAVATMLRAQGLGVVLIGDRNDDWVRPHFSGIDVIDRIGAHTLDQTLALLRDSDLVISHDTGPMHLARLVRAPMIALFGPTSPHEFIVPDDQTRVLWGGAGLACRPCYDGREFADCTSNICIQEVTAEMVVKHALEMVEGRHEG